MTRPAVQLLGESCLVLTASDRIDRATCLRLIRAAKQLRERSLAGVRDVLNTYTTVAVHFDPDASDAAELRCLLQNCYEAARDVNDESDAGEHHVLPTTYDGEDLSRVAQHACLPIDGVIELHASATYLVGMIGFQPHFPYLLGLPKQLRVPRLDSPRPRVPAGSVAIATEQAGVYPAVSPGGWNLLGRCDPKLLAAIQPGDTVTFEPVESL